VNPSLEAASAASCRARPRKSIFALAAAVAAVSWASDAPQPSPPAELSAVSGRAASAAAPAAVISMVVATLLWGATFVVIRDSLAGLSPATLVAVRFGIAAIVLATIARLRGVRLSRRARQATLRAGIAGGIAAAGGYLFQAIGLTSSRAGSSAFLTSTGTLFAALFAWPLLGQRPGGRLVLGIAIALVGSALLGVRGDLQIGAGDAWTLLGALCFALQVCDGRK